MMNGNRSADPAPDLGSILSRRHAGDVNARSAFALDHVVHGESETKVLHQVNASFSCERALKDDEALGR